MTAFFLKDVGVVRPAQGIEQLPEIPAKITNWIAEREDGSVEVGQAVVAELHKGDDPDTLSIVANVVSIVDVTLSVMFALTFAEDIAGTIDGGVLVDTPKGDD